MVDEINLPLILIAAFLGAASPGPSTLAIAGTSMASGRRHGLALASGITTGSFSWSIMAALGLSAIMLANAWMFEVLRYCAALYLMYLALKSARSAFSPSSSQGRPINVATGRSAYVKGLALHLTNPKAVLFFGALFAIGVPAGSSPAALAMVIAAVGLQSTLIFHGYALLFSSPPMMTGYLKLRRGFEALFAIGFGAAGLRVLTARFE
jgi:threonine efflux protein